MMETILNCDSLNGQEFEAYCASILEKSGFANVQITKGSQDHGVDVLAEKDGFSYAVQCKRYANNVPNKAIQEVFTGRAFYSSDFAVVMTNQDFTRQAIEEAAQLGRVDTSG